MNKLRISLSGFTKVYCRHYITKTGLYLFYVASVFQISLKTSSDRLTQCQRNTYS